MSVLNRRVADNAFIRAFLTHLDEQRAAALDTGRRANADGLLCLIAHLRCSEGKGRLAADVRIAALAQAQTQGGTYRPGKLQAQLIQSVGTAFVGWEDAAETFTELACCAIEDAATEYRKQIGALESQSTELRRQVLEGDALRHRAEAAEAALAQARADCEVVALRSAQFERQLQLLRVAEVEPTAEAPKPKAPAKPKATA